MYFIHTNYSNVFVVLYRECGCVEAGSRDSQPTCEQATGQCNCKENVEGLNCDRYVFCVLHIESCAKLFLLTVSKI